MKGAAQLSGHVQEHHLRVRQRSSVALPQNRPGQVSMAPQVASLTSTEGTLGLPELRDKVQCRKPGETASSSFQAHRPIPSPQMPG
jgi:hypothetical protein